MYTYEYPRLSLTVDSVLFYKANQTFSVLLIQRDKAPFEGCWAIPGGFVDMDETLLNAAKRELKEETGIEGVDLEMLGVFDEPLRDPRGRTVSVAYLGITTIKFQPVAADDARNAEWFNINNLPDLAFDHQNILEMALSKFIIR
jgi:8-oxo-dGTP diphosphatase